MTSPCDDGDRRHGDGTPRETQRTSAPSAVTFLWDIKTDAPD
jgi:hypothetical protein